MTLLLNCVAALAYAIGAAFMKSSDAFRHLGASIAVFACFGLAATLQTIAMKHQDLSVGYVVVLGLEAIAATALGVLVFREPMTATRLCGIALVIAGMLCLRSW